MKVFQRDMFGGEKPLEQVQVQKVGRNKYKTMQATHGLRKDKKCRDCKHLYCKPWRVNYYKCDMWYQSNSSATDIRLKDVACNMFEERDG